MVSYDIWIRGLSVEYCVFIIVIERHNSSSPCIDGELACLELLRAKGELPLLIDQVDLNLKDSLTLCST